MGIIGCKKNENLLMEKESKLQALHSTEDLVGETGYAAMADFKERVIGFPGTTISDMSVDRAQWIMEATLNFEYGSLRHESVNEFYESEIDSLDFFISIAPDGLLIGASVLENYVQLESDMTNLESGQFLVLADIELISTSLTQAHYRAYRISGLWLNPPPYDWPTSKFASNYTWCPGAPQNSKTSTQIINHKLSWSILVQEGYWSNISIGKTYSYWNTTLSELWRGTNPNECISHNDYYDQAVTLRNQYFSGTISPGIPQGYSYMNTSFIGEQHLYAYPVITYYHNMNIRIGKINSGVYPCLPPC